MQFAGARRAGAAMAVAVACGLALLVLGASSDDVIEARTVIPPPPVAQPISGKVATSPAPASGLKPPADVLEAFRGLSTWIDTYDVGLTPQQQVDIAAAAGVDAIYIQASRQRTQGLIHDADRLAETIELAHDAGILIMIWTIPDFVDLELDRARAIAAMSFTTPRGDRPDAFGLDIEVEALRDVPERSRRLVQLSRELREWAGPGYPMAAVTLPPRQLEINLTWWPDFPYAALAEHYDVFVPMSYSSFRGTDAQTTYQWNHDNVILTRQLAGVPDLPVHLAGGIADELPAVDAFVQAAVDSGAIGAGLYDLHTTPPTSWPSLRPLSLSRQP